MDSQSWFFFTLSLHYGTLPVAVTWRSLLLSECWPASNLKKLFSIEIFAPECYTKSLWRAVPQPTDHIPCKAKQTYKVTHVWLCMDWKYASLWCCGKIPGPRSKVLVVFLPWAAPWRPRVVGLFPQGLVSLLEHWLVPHYWDEVVKLKREIRLPLWFALVSISMMFAMKEMHRKT